MNKERDLTSWHEIFRPGRFPAYNFVERHAQTDVIKNFINYGATPFLAITGISGIGKTVLIKHVIEKINSKSDREDKWNLISLQSTWFQGSLEGFKEQLSSQLGIYGSEQSSNQELTFFARLFNYRQGWSKKILMPITEQQILDSLNNKVIVIDDFHRLTSEVQRKILGYLKGFTNSEMLSDNCNFRFIIIYIPYKLVSQNLVDMELGSKRVQHVAIPLWTQNELINIARMNFRDNNLVLTNAETLAKHAFGLPSLMQQLCLSYCMDHHNNELNQIVNRDQIINITGQRCKETLSSLATEIWHTRGDNFYPSITVAGREHRILYETKNGNLQGTIYQLIWYALTLDHDHASYITQDTQRHTLLISSIKQKLEQHTLVPTHIISDISRNIDVMSQYNNEEYQNRLEVTKYDFKEDPLFEYKPDSFNQEDSKLIINDPEFLFALSYAQQHHRKLAI